MPQLWKDAVLALRRLRAAPGFAAVALLTLALGIGANVAIFTLLDAVVLEPLPYPRAEALVRVWPEQNFNKALLREVEAGVPAFEEAAGLSHWDLSLTNAGDGAARIPGAVVSPSWFDLLGVQAMLGRTFTAADAADQASSAVVVLSHALWMERFGGDPAILGRTLELDGAENQRARTVVGVLGPDYRHPVARFRPQAFVPLPRTAYPLAVDSSFYVNFALARLRPGATAEGAQNDLRALALRLREEAPAYAREDRIRNATVAPLQADIVGSTAGTLWLLFGAVGLVLLIACANLANLLLARGAGREREVAVRKALGASRGRLVVQGLMESAVLGVLGGALGLLMAAWSLALLRPELEARLPRVGEAGLDGGVLAFALLASLGAALLFGALPAARAAGRTAASGLRGTSRSATAAAGAHRLNRVLVAAEVALAVLLVAGAGLVLRGYWNLHGTAPGFATADVLAVEVAPPPAAYPSVAEVDLFYRDVTARLAALPGVRAVSGIHLLPLAGSNWRFPYLAEGATPSADEPLPSANFRAVRPHYFATTGVAVERGRELTPADAAGAERVMVINRALADVIWPGEDPLGREIAIFGNQPFRVVGVVADVRQTALDAPAEPELYVAQAQWIFPVTTMTLMVRFEGAPPGLRAVSEAVWTVDPDVPVPTARTLADVVADSVGRQRLVAALLAAFAGLALVLGAVGVYGVMAYVTGTRLREFAVRLALGAAPGEIQRQAVAGGMVPVLAGLGMGMAAALASGRLVSGLLHEVSPTDPLTLATVAALLLAVAALATWLPARRASRVDPARVLKGE